METFMIFEPEFPVFRGTKFLLSLVPITRVDLNFSLVTKESTFHRTAPGGQSVPGVVVRWKIHLFPEAQFKELCFVLRSRIEK
jgi:hypothetical protein